jgi:cytochrome P450
MTKGQRAVTSSVNRVTNCSIARAGGPSFVERDVERGILVRVRATPSSALRHIPGQDGLPLFGDTFAYVKDPFLWTVNAYKKYGAVYRTNMFFEAGVIVTGAEFAERFFMDRERVFSSERGWESILGAFFQRGLMLRDFDVHRYHRRIMQAAFKHEALVGYLSAMYPILVRAIGRLAGSRAYPWVKQVTLDAATSIFLGLEDDEDARRVNGLFTEIMIAAAAAFRWNLPATAYGRGLRARRLLRDWVTALIPERRKNPGRDMLSALCTAASEDGDRFSDDEIADHLLFLLMAAHDTTTSALTNLIMELGRRPEWQARLRAQSRTLGAAPPTEETLHQLTLVYDCFREVLRMYPPVRSIPRRTLCEIEMGGYLVPANTQVWLDVEMSHRDPSLFTNPGEFDPERFSDARAEHKRHRFAWMPFGGGAHTCLGLQFGELQVKLLMHLLLLRYSWTTEAGPMQYLPFVKPKDDLPLRLTAIDQP